MLLPASVEAVVLALDTAERILVISHAAPDGDAISSLIATGLALQHLEKKYSLVNDDGLPERFCYLPLATKIMRTPESTGGYDLIIALDAGSPRRLGKAYLDLPKPLPPILNIDHHITNTLFGEVNLVVPEANATVEILFHLFPALGVKITPDLATCLLSGLVTDTLGFRTAGVTASTLRTASDLVDAGADLFTVTTKALNLKPLSALLMWQKGLNNIQIEDGVIWTSISNKERLDTGHEDLSSFGLGNMMAEVYEATMSAVLLELPDGRVKVGFRCRPPYSVSELAMGLGGGGHHLAAGCTLEGSLEKVETLIIDKSKESIREQRVRQALSDTEEDER